MKCSQQVPKGLQLYSHCPFPPSRAGVKMYVFIRWVSIQFCILEHEVETVWCATFQSKAFVFSLLLLQCLVENVILKLLLYICQCHKGVLIFPKVCPCAGTKWLFSLYYVPLPQCVMLHLMSTSQMTRKLFHIQSPTESIADISRPPSWYSGPHHQEGDCSYNPLQSPLFRDGMWIRAPLPSLACGRQH